MSLPAARRLSALVGAKNPREALVTGAQIYINFLSLTRRSGWLQAHISKQKNHPDPSQSAIQTFFSSLGSIHNAYFGWVCLVSSASSLL